MTNPSGESSVVLTTTTGVLMSLEDAREYRELKQLSQRGQK